MQFIQFTLHRKLCVIHSIPAGMWIHLQQLCCPSGGGGFYLSPITRKAHIKILESKLIQPTMTCEKLFRILYVYIQSTAGTVYLHKFFLTISWMMLVMFAIEVLIAWESWYYAMLSIFWYILNKLRTVSPLPHGFPSFVVPDTKSNSRFVFLISLFRKIFFKFPRNHQVWLRIQHPRIDGTELCRI